MTDSISEIAIGTDPGVLTRGLEARLPELAAPVQPKWLARAPECLDVMGGIAELSGALVLSTPLREALHALVGPREDERIRVVTVDPSGGTHAGNGEPLEADWALSVLYADDGALAATPAWRSRVAARASRVDLAVLAVAHAMLRAGLVPHLRGGFTIVIGAGEDGEADCRHIATVQAATIAALARWMGVACSPGELARVCSGTQASVLGYPIGIATHAGPLLAAPGKLLQVCCRTSEVGEALPIPRGVTLVGIDSGARHGQAEEKYLNARTAALMGREIIAHLLPQHCKQATAWDGHLSRVSVTDYVDQLRDRIPTKLKGALYLERFGPLNDGLAAIDPGKLYKVRSRAEHHIYEDDRVRQFAERMSRAARTGAAQALREAGELMYASHWSYGQRCGLGSIETDLLVNLLRQEGERHGIHGARVSGAGAGGTVAVLLDDTSEAFDAVHRAASLYRERTGKTPRLRPCAEPNSPGLVVTQPN